MKVLGMLFLLLAVVACNSSDGGGDGAGASGPGLKSLGFLTSDSTIQEVRYSINGGVYLISDGSIECEAGSSAKLEVDTDFRSDIQFNIPCIEDEDVLKRVFYERLAFYAFEGMELERVEGQNDGLPMRINGSAEFTDFTVTYCLGEVDEYTHEIMYAENLVDIFYEPDMTRFNDDYSYSYMSFVNFTRWETDCFRNRTDGLPSGHNVYNFYDEANFQRHYRYKEGELEVLLARRFRNPFDRNENFYSGSDVFHPDTNNDLNAYDDSGGTFLVYRFERFQRK